MKIIVNLEVLENNQVKGKAKFKEDFEYKNQSNKFNLKQYEKTIEKNLISEISNDIISYLYTLQ